MNRLVQSFVALVFAVAVLVPPVASAADLPHHHLALFSGYAKETIPGRDPANGFALGLEWELRFHEKWGVGAIMEFLGLPSVKHLCALTTIRNVHGKKRRIVVEGGWLWETRRGFSKACGKVAEG